MSEQEKISKNNKIVDILNDVQDAVYDIQHEGNLTNIKERVAGIIREFRQGIERLRRITDGDDAPVKFLTREGIARLGRDELAFIVDSFWDWYNEDECPAERCDDYFCHYCQDVKERADEELADGDMNAEDYNHLAKNGFYDGLCCGSHDGCWPVFFLWCYRNGYDAETGKKKEANNG